MSPLEIARACLQAYVDKNRVAVEALIADDFHFTSPLDNAIDRATYFKRCWPNSAAMQKVIYIEQAEQGDCAFLVYESEMGGKRLRNCEMYRTRGGKLSAVEVYFGWNLPHPAPVGGWVPE